MLYILCIQNNISYTFYYYIILYNDNICICIYIYMYMYIYIYVRVHSGRLSVGQFSWWRCDVSSAWKFVGGPAMKIETLLLTLLFRFLEVGVRDKLPAPQTTQIESYPTGFQQFVCDCHCTCLNNNGGFSRDILVWLAGVFVPTAAYFLIRCCRQKEVSESYHASPRRKGGGVVVMPARG